MKQDEATTAASEPEAAPLPEWLREIDNSLVIAPHVVIAGNVLDFHLVGPRLIRSVPEALWAVLEPAGYEFLLVYDAVDRLTVLPRAPDPAADAAASAAAALLGAAGGSDRDLSGVSIDAALRAVQETTEHRVALAVDQASRLLLDQSSPERSALTTFRLADRLAAKTRPVFRNDASLYNVVFWITQSERDLPDWFASANPRVRIVALPSPTAGDRRTIAKQLAADDPTLADTTPTERGHLVDDAVDSTAGLPLRAMEEISQLARRRREGLAGFPDAARAYRIGIAESPWQHEEIRDRVREAEEKLRARVLGQESAIRLSLDILTRSVTGLTGAHAGGSAQRPRGVLFFAGPTGVGKTELAKALTELVFGTVDQYVRFDMSEFTAEHAEARLIGAPPGYVGHDAGGELTNALRRQPFSLVLFDEIEKAHPRILDKFLQVLDDGRLTDGAGATVYFTEAILVFTSNAGMDEPLPDRTELGPTTDAAIMEEAVRRGVERYFRQELGRPELLNRLGGNIVVFRYITPPVAAAIFDLALARVEQRLLATHGATLEVSEAARTALREYATADLTMGGRGIGSRLEHALVNPLARHVFANTPASGSTVVIASARGGEFGWELEVA